MIHLHPILPRWKADEIDSSTALNDTDLRFADCSLIMYQCTHSCSIAYITFSISPARVYTHPLFGTNLAVFVPETNLHIPLTVFAWR